VRHELSYDGDTRKERQDLPDTGKAHMLTSSTKDHVKTSD
jgi:hypothetical protein